MFGVGATSARSEADRKTQLNLRRTALLVLSCPMDTFSPNVKLLEEKIQELLTATPTSSPSSATRADVFMLLRALVMKLSSLHLSSLWPLINAELQSALLSTLPSQDEQEKYNNQSLIQACKLLDTLLVLNLDEFQLHEWLYITDTIDAEYRPLNVPSTGLADNIYDQLSQMVVNMEPIQLESSAFLATSASGSKRQPVMDTLINSMQPPSGVEAVDVKTMKKHDLAVLLLRPFFAQVSLAAFKATYGMVDPDIEACFDGVLQDLFSDPPVG